MIVAAAGEILVVAQVTIAAEPTKRKERRVLTKLSEEDDEDDIDNAETADREKRLHDDFGTKAEDVGAAAARRTRRKRGWRSDLIVAKSGSQVQSIN
mmetsp:Transcript_21200/g.43418  ORF Transcript_21200/g.43418 Transcript_21200/m.43418 type:complete len:97 (-) Transcript_21200:122-412(-)